MRLNFYIGATLLVLGAIVLCISMLGVFRFKYVMNRMHAAAITDTLGSLLIIAGLIVIRGLSFASIKMIIIIALIWITGPICTNRLAHTEFTISHEYKSHCEVEDQ